MMISLKRQGIIFLAGLTAILLIGLFGQSPEPNVAVSDQNVVANKDLNAASCDGATQWTPHGPYIGPVR
jgi:hypothetical protein